MRLFSIWGGSGEYFGASAGRTGDSWVQHDLIYIYYQILKGIIFRNTINHGKIINSSQSKFPETNNKHQWELFLLDWLPGHSNLRKVLLSANQVSIRFRPDFQNKSTILRQPWYSSYSSRRSWVSKWARKWAIFKECKNFLILESECKKCFWYPVDRYWKS